ncbi:MAG TPA: SgcJ/EcaC family oxidoreductase [Marmoricola sp.]|nr:SgcJ/EcaC family oxidoreductase [Marmoricola sp.]
MSEQEIRDVLDAYAATVHARDVDGHVGLYDDDVHLFDAWEEFEARGKEALRAATEQWFGSLGEERVRVTFDDAIVVADGDVGFVHAAVVFAAETASGERVRAMRNRFTFGLRRDGRWRIVHQHSSLPISMVTMTAVPPPA